MGLRELRPRAARRVVLGTSLVDSEPPSRYLHLEVFAPAGGTHLCQHVVLWLSADWKSLLGPFVPALQSIPPVAISI